MRTLAKESKSPSPGQMAHSDAELVAPPIHVGSAQRSLRWAAVCGK